MSRADRSSLKLLRQLGPWRAAALLIVHVVAGGVIGYVVGLMLDKLPFVAALAGIVSLILLLRTVIGLVYRRLGGD